MAQHYTPSFSHTAPFPLTKKPRGEAEARRSLRLRIWLARCLFAALFAGALALLAYEVRLAYESGWRATLHMPIPKR